MKHRQVKLGVLLSYGLIVLNALYGLFLTPFLLHYLGEAEYGVYKTVSSLSASLMVLDLGIGGTVMRYTAQYRADRQTEKLPNFISMNLIQAAILDLLIVLFAAGIFSGIDSAYAATFNESQLRESKLLFCVLIFTMLIHVFENVLNGVITGSNQFIFGNGVKLARLLLRVLLIVALLPLFPSALLIVGLDVLITLFFLGAEVIFIARKLKIRVRLTKWDNRVFFDSGKYTVLMFLTSVAAQVNNNLDNVVIGALKGPGFVAIYSVGLLIFGMFENLSTAVSGVMLPTVMNTLKEKDGDTRVVDLIVRAGRVQFMLLGAAYAGFVCLGRDFISIWLGDGFETVYPITLILMTPAMFELCVNVCLAVLRAKNTLVFRTVVLISTTALNAAVTWIAVKYWSYVGAAFGTALSFLIGSLLIMNIYYRKKLGFPMLKIYRRIFSRTWLCILVSGIVLGIFRAMAGGSVLAFVLGIVLFAAVYAVTMLLYGLGPDEKSLLKLGGKKNG